MSAKAKHLVIVGGGFAGVELAKRITQSDLFTVTLVDKNNYNFFPPLIYQVATGFLEPSNISYPFRKLFRNKKNFHFCMGEFIRVVPGENRIETSACDISYDYLVFATGTQSNFFGIQNVMKYAVPMKTINDAIELRNYILQTAEKATTVSDPALRKRLLTIVVAGAGPSGVEISGVLAEMKKFIFKKDYPELVHDEIEIYLVDAGTKVLAPMSVQSQNYTHKQLEELGVKIMLNMGVKDYVDHEVVFANGQRIATDTLIWTAGVTGTDLPGLPAEMLGRGKRVLVDAFNKVQGSANIFAIGDICLQTTDQPFPNGHPQLAQVAIQQGRLLAKNLVRWQQDQQPESFKYNDKGSMAIIGRNKAVADVGKLHMKGILAFFAWVFVHIWSLINYRNKLKTFYNWFSAYLTRDMALRFIFRPGKPKT